MKPTLSIVKAVRKRGPAPLPSKIRIPLADGTFCEVPVLRHFSLPCIYEDEERVLDFCIVKMSAIEGEKPVAGVTLRLTHRQSGMSLGELFVFKTKRPAAFEAKCRERFAEQVPGRVDLKELVCVAYDALLATEGYKPANP